MSRLWELARVFGLLGLIGFGGPAAHIALMRRELVERRGWLSDTRFVDLLGITNLLPGPNSTELALHIGLDRGGRLGLLVAGVAFILPAAILVAVLAAAYVAAGSTPTAEALLYGVKPVIIAIIVAAIGNLARTALAGPMRSGLAVLACVLALAGLNELLVLVGAALAMAFVRGLLGERAWLARIGLLAPSAGAAGLAAASVSLPVLFVTFLKIGAVLYGSGYVLVAFLRADFVEGLGWLTDRQLLDAVAMGQVTPGPLFSTATFVGYLVAGPVGALLATVAIFLPAFVYVSLLGGVVDRLRERPLTGALLDGVTAGALGLMAAVTLQLAGNAIVDWFSAALALVAGGLLLWGRVLSVWLVLGGALAGLLVRAA